MTGFKINDEIEQAYRQGFTDAKTPAAAQVVQIKGKLPSLNDYIGECRKNPHAGAKMKKDAETLIMVQLGRMQRITSPVIIHFEWHEKNARRDKDNVAAAKKFILDALQKAGKLENDNNKYIAGFSDAFIYGVDYGVTLRIEAVRK